MATLCLDIETIPTDVPDATRQFLSAMADRHEQNLDTFMATCPALARIVCVGLLNPDTGDGRVLIDWSLFGGQVPEGSVGIDGEKALLAELHAIVAKYNRLVTYNGRGFDIPTIIHRSWVHRVPIAPIVEKCAWQKPWESLPSLDVMAEMTFGGATRKYGLSVYALAHGIENPKAGGDGAHVARLVREQQPMELASYCMGDVRATAELAKRTGLLAG